ncbi:DNA polymerase III subunit alpha [Mycoplasma sp. P36-A1]|uniref:DNA polymerase III subunit alpha n=1 Tax=Mycoplasma sp. P36-A1 TaxID=3252900 RepID=UPI003C2D2F9B
MLINLNVKSHYTNKNSLLKPIDIINFSKNNNSKYAAICDLNYFGGALEFIKIAQKNNIIPILGLEFEIKDQYSSYTTIAYAKNIQGYKTLQKISSILYENNKKYLELDSLKDNQENLFIVIDILKSKIYQDYLLENDNYQDTLNFYKENFNQFYYYVDNYYFDEEFIKQFRIDYNYEKEILANPVRYYQPEDEATLKILQAIDNQTKLDSKIDSLKGNQYLKDEKQLKENKDAQTINNTQTFIMQFSDIILPQIDTLPMFKSTTKEINDYLTSLSIYGLKKRLKTDIIPNNYLNRLKYELSIIIKMNYSNYFLVVYDYVLFAKSNNILVGPGRGSSAGSLVAYTLGITNVDPIINNLIFERFLNPERISLPDIDVDFQTNKREEVIQYLISKYGYEHVAHIVTFGTFQAKNSLSDVAKVMQLPDYKVNNLKKLIPDVAKVRLIELLKTEKAINYMLDQDEKLNFVYHQAIKLENIIRHMSTHAAGILLTKEKLIEYVPTIKIQEQPLLEQYDMTYLEDIGLNKMDILGLETLDVLSGILDDIEEKIDLNKIPLNDKKTLDLMSSGKTLGIFQFESDGVINVLKRMKIDSINDMVATTALFRPGPMKYIDNYIARKNNLEKVDYIVDDLKPILQETYGIIVYQEQIMQITQVMAGFSLAKADIVRKGMAKKQIKVLENIKTDFIQNATLKGYSHEVATKVFAMILQFSDYGFNKAHAYSYALLGYYLAYLKANYPKEFFNNVLYSNINKVDKIKKYAFEMKDYDLKLKTPDINLSTLKFNNIDNYFVLPFTSIAGIGQAAAKSIIEIREQNNNHFSSYIDAVAKLKMAHINESTIKNLIYAGAFDGFSYNRKTMIENLTKVQNYIEINNLDSNQTILPLNVVAPPKIVPYQETEEVLNHEYELLKLYLKNNPLDKYLKDNPQLILDNIKDNKQAIAIVDSIKEIKTKKNLQLMAFVRVSDQYVSKTLIIFPKTYIRIKPILNVKNVILIIGKEDEKEVDNIIVDNIKVLNKN